MLKVHTHTDDCTNPCTAPNYTFNPFPSDLPARVKYSMAVMSRLFAENNMKTPTKEHPIKIKYNDPDETRYLWTACLVIGKNTANIRFSSEAIKTMSNFSPWLELEHSFLWWGEKFNKTSLYESVFKHHLTPNMLIISASTPLYDNIPGSITIKEQEDLKNQALIQEHEKLNPPKISFQPPPLSQQPNPMRENSKKKLSQQPLVTHNVHTDAAPMKTIVKKEQETFSNLEQLLVADPNLPSEAILQSVREHTRAAERDNIEAAVQLAQFYRVDHAGIKKDLNLAVDYYMKATKLGYQKALVSLETLCEEMSPQKQLALSDFYASIFNHEKAAYWSAKATETGRINRLM